MPVIFAGTVDLSATNNSVYTPDVNSVNAAIAGGSGAVATTTETTAANATVLANTVIMASSAVDITARNTFTETVPTSGNTVSGGAGGVINGSAAVSKATLTGTSSVTIGGSVMINVETPSTPGTGTAGIVVTASSALDTNDQVTLTTGGVIEGAGTNSSLTATLNNNVTTGLDGHDARQLHDQPEHRDRHLHHGERRRTTARSAPTAWPASAAPTPRPT